MKDRFIAALEASKTIQFEASSFGSVSDEGTPAYSQQVLPMSMFKGTKGYIEKLVNQINGTYERGWFDGCAVMIRRLLETLIIEAFEKKGKAENIKGHSGDFVYLNELVTKTVAETSWNLSRNSKKALPKLKDVGDKSAHSRRFNARRWDIDKVVDDLRVVTEELLFLAELK